MAFWGGFCCLTFLIPLLLMLFSACDYGSLIISIISPATGTNFYLQCSPSFLLGFFSARANSSFHPHLPSPTFLICSFLTLSLYTHTHMTMAVCIIFWTNKRNSQPQTVRHDMCCILSLSSLQALPPNFMTDTTVVSLLLLSNSPTNSPDRDS